MKRVRVDPEAVRKTNREAASKEELIKALEAISDELLTVEEQHRLGVHRFILDGDCTGNSWHEACYIQCSWCYTEDCVVENTVLDLTETDGSRICFDCLDKMADIAAKLQEQQPANKKQKVDLNIILLP